jgi:hypothetical protein
MANVLLDILRSMAVGAAADKAREQVAPVMNDVLMSMAAPQEAITEGARMIDGYPSMSSGLEAITAPYQPNRGFTAEAADPSVVQQMVQDAYDEQMLRQSEVDADIAAENAQNAAGVQDFVRRASVSPIANLPDEAELMKQLDPRKMEAANISPQRGYELAQAAGTINILPEVDRVAKETGDESIFDKFTSKLSEAFQDEEAMLTMAMAFNSLRYKPDQGLASFLSKRIENLSTARANKESAVAAAEQLKKMGYGNMADYVIKNPKLAPKLMEAAAKRQMEAGEYVSGSGKDIMEKYGITGLNPSLPYRYNTRTKKIEGVGGGGTSIYNVPDAPKNMQWEYDEMGRPIRVVPIKGSPEEEAARERESSKRSMTGIIGNAANKIRGAMSGGMLPETGTISKALSYIGETDAAEVRRQVSVLKSQAQVETLNAMRRQSPTGGALGSVTERELSMLSAKAGALDPDADPETFMAALDDYQRTLYEIVHGYDAGRELFSEEMARFKPEAQAAKQTPRRKYNPATGRVE